MKITDILLAEHLVFHNVFDYIEKTLPRAKTVAEVKALAGLMENLLRAHSKSEEDLVFAPLEHCLEQIGQRDTFENEHHEIDASLLKVKVARQLAEARALLFTAVQASRKHFDHEERIVFPLAEEFMKRETLSKLGNLWLHRREEAKTPPSQNVVKISSAALTPAVSAATRVSKRKAEGASSV
jgi:hemerythrin-like domain-containing protein